MFVAQRPLDGRGVMYKRNILQYLPNFAHNVMMSDVFEEECSKCAGGGGPQSIEQTYSMRCGKDLHSVHSAMMLLMSLLFELFPKVQGALRSDAWADMLFSILERHGWSQDRLRTAKYSLPDEIRQSFLFFVSLTSII
jgi:hypothetical protein